MSLKFLLLVLAVLCFASEMKIIFNFIDRNKDGVISAEEIALYLEEYKISDFKDALGGAKNLLGDLESITWEEFYKRYQHLDSPKSASQPEQIHLSITNDPTEMVVMWATKGKN